MMSPFTSYLTVCNTTAAQIFPVLGTRRQATAAFGSFLLNKFDSGFPQPLFGWGSIEELGPKAEPRLASESDK